jgi:hypothetical protein
MPDEKSTAAIVAAIRQRDADGGWNHETLGGWPDMATYRALQRAVDAGQIEHSAAYGAECWRLTDEGVALRRSLS